MEERLFANEIENRVSMPLEPLVDEANHQGKCPGRNLRLSPVTTTIGRLGLL
ncbi:Hypothetical protein NGAL_HAMBI1189_41920 [Neorhizobium galegae bv. officinalis]|uniref:Uncharacterized protein n=1 Tax=Neorhizobium galegae bv. officinalis TaxID=323656 RepID=A0A0T7GX65_NEOGA|nr:Hypothetical protein NGAL_HAMBI1189_41920 [Neorhizobium galegae bv. officinalis]